MANLNDLNNTPDITSELDPRDIKDNQLMGILAYISWLVLIPIFAAKDSKFARFHVNQGLVLAVTEIVCVILGNIPLVGWIISTLGGLGCFILSILGIINAYNGKAKELPIIGKFKILK